MTSCYIKGQSITDVICVDDCERDHDEHQLLDSRIPFLYRQESFLACWSVVIFDHLKLSFFNLDEDFSDFASLSEEDQVSESIDNAWRNEKPFFAKRNSILIL